MTKGSLFRAILGIGGAVAAVLVIHKDNRDKLEAEYNRYKRDSQSYKDNAKGKATQLGTIANETIKEVKTNPKGYANRLKNNLETFSKKEESKFIEYDNKTDESIEKGRFDDEGGAAPNGSLHTVTEEDLKENKNALSDKEQDVSGTETIREWDRNHILTKFISPSRPGKVD